MNSKPAAWGPLSHQLESARHTAGARRLVLAWQDPEGDWRHLLRCRDDMVAQAEERLLDDLFRLYHAHPDFAGAWSEVLHRWHAESGSFVPFSTEDGKGFFAAFCESGREWPEHTSLWLSLVLPALVSAVNETDRNRSLYSQRQAVLESAVSLASAESTAALLVHATRLARRLFNADAAATFAALGELPRSRPRCLAEDPASSSHPDSFHLDLWYEKLCTTRKPVTCQTKGDSATVPDLVSLMAVPFRNAEAAKMAMVLRRDVGRPYTMYDQFTFAVFCRQVEGVLENQQLLARLKAANQELTATQAQVVESARLQMLGEVASSVAHDFNNVLGALLGRVQLLQHAARDAAVQLALTKMERVIAQGEDIVKRLQEAARHKRVDIKLTLDALVRDLYATTEATLRHESQIHDRKVVWLTEFMPTATVIESATKARSALRQLLTDVSAQAPDDSVIELRTRRHEGTDRLTLVLAVQPSQGASPFDWTTLSGYAVFATAMEQAGGKLELRSEDGVSTLDVCLYPLGARGTGEPHRRSKLSVLVVDDDQDVRDVLSELLITDGHEVTTAEDGAAGLKQFAGGHYDIVFTDLGMPGISGWQVVEQIKRDAPEVPVVMVTGWGHQLERSQVERSGVDRVLTKPFQWLKVLDALHELVPRHTPPTAS